MRMLKTLTACFLAIALLGGCIRVYKIDVQQGNELSQKQVDALSVGMNRENVRTLLGTPLIDDPFRNDRWDYFYAFKAGRSKDVTRRKLSLFFDGDRLARIEGGLETETVRESKVDIEQLVEVEEAKAKKQEEEKPGFWDRVSTSLQRAEGE